MPIDLKNYPVNWKSISLKVKQDTNWTCQHCGQKCRMPKEPLADFFDRTGITSEDDRSHPQRFTG